MSTHLIPAENLPGLKARFVKLARKAEKLGVPAPTLTVAVTPVMKSVNEYEVEVSYSVEVKGESPSYSGWTLEAVIELDRESDETPNVVHILPGVVADPEWRLLSERCDHCHVNNRRRTKLVAVLHEDGTTKIVGSTCLQDFLGGVAPATIAAWAEMLADAVTDEDEKYVLGSTREFRVDPVSYLAFVARCIASEGWVSRGAAGWGVIATADLAYKALMTERVVMLTDDEYSKATMCLEWAKGQGGNDYLDNVSAVALKASWAVKNLGVAASIVSAYDREMGREIERVERAKVGILSEFVGTLGAPVEFEAKVVDVRMVDGFYGTKALVKMLDTNGNVLIWWASNPSKAPGQGDAVQGKATVKGHEVYQDMKQTTVIRAKLTIAA